MAIHSTIPVIVKAEFDHDAASINAGLQAVQTVTVNGLRPGYPVQVWCEELTTGLAISNPYCSAANELKFTLVNNTAGAVNADELTFKVIQR